MYIDLSGGRYVLAVSGGVDSMVLLELLRQKKDIELVIAHYDHGIRSDSLEDRKLVQAVAKQHGMQFVYDEGNLGLNTSEAIARKARYDFLHKVRQASGARGIITAHHQDDLIETAILNLIRGTGSRGLSSLQSTDSLYRPLLGVTKNELRQYAENNNIAWREDSTNQDTKYLRNYVRHTIIPKLSDSEKQKLLEIIKNASKTNVDIKNQLIVLLHDQPAIDTIDRHWFVMLPSSVASEVMNEWLKRHNVKDINKRMVNNLVIIAKTSPPNRVADIDKTHILEIGKKNIKITPRSR